MLVKNVIEFEQMNAAKDRIENLQLQISVLRADNNDLKMERDLYKKLFEEEITLHYSKASKAIKVTKKKANPAFLRWLHYRSHKA
ncbi:MAG: hypothetical protein ACK4NR_12340 [Micavibrio sp.]